MNKLIIQKNSEHVKGAFEDESTKKIALLFTNPTKSKLDISFNLSSTGSSLELLLLFYGLNGDNFNIDLNVHHTAPQTFSRISVLSVLNDESVLNCAGSVFVKGTAVEADTFLRCDSLLLSNKSKVMAVPSLEIETNDVKAGHSASIGRVDDEKLFYFLSRGFSEEQAKQLLVEAFLSSAVNVFKGIPPEEASRLKEEMMEIGALA